MSEVFLLSAVRTPIGKFLGGLSPLTAPQLGAVACAEALRRAGVGPEQVDEVILGNVLQAGVGQNPARQAALRAELPDTVAAVTVNKVCGSGLKAVMLAAQAIRAGDADLVLAGGMESMSQAPFLLMGARTGWKFGDQKAQDAMVRDGLWCPFENQHMGESAEYIAGKYDIEREELDRFAAQSQQRAAAAWLHGKFAHEVVPVVLPRSGGAKQSPEVATDEGVRSETTVEGLAKLRPSFREGGCVTAGNSSTLSDGAAALVVASAKGVGTTGTNPLARVVAYATSGVAPRDIFIAPVSAVRKVLDRAGLGIEDIELFELNEAFAAQMLACNHDLKIPEAKLNVHGGAIALGHPIGASGARVLVTLLHALHQTGGRRGLAALCLGGGNAVAMIVERV